MHCRRHTLTGLALRSSMGNSPRVAILLATFLTAFALPTMAQVYSGSLTGVVSDPTGAVVPGSKVTITDVAKGYAYSATTDEVGRYVISSLPPSTYKLTVEAHGFKTAVRDGITLDVNQRASLDVRLELGQAVQLLEVVGAAPVLSTQDAVQGQELNRTFVNDLPLVGRAIFDLAFLTPGVVQAPGATFGPNSMAINWSSNGGRNSTAEVLIDGVTATSYEANTAVNNVLYQPSVDAVQEFKVQNSNFSAEVGFTGNTYVNMVLRSGTNQIHGSAWNFLRNDKLDANDWFSNRSGGKIAPLRRNQFGFTVGGPIRRDKTFFFGDFEGTREHSLAVHSAGVPSAAMRQGDFGEICTAGFDANGLCADGEQQLWDPYSGIYDAGNGGPTLRTFIPFNNLATYMSDINDPNNVMAQLPATQQLPQVPGNLIDPVSYNMMQFYPLPNVNVGTPQYNRFNNWTGSGINLNSNDQFDVRVDHRFTDATTIYGRFSWGRNSYHGANCFNNPLDPCTQGPGAGGTRSAVLTMNHTFSPTTLLNASYGFTRWRTFTQGIAADYPDFDPATTLGLPDYIKRSGTVASPVVYIYGGYRQASGEALGAQAWSVYRNGQEVHNLQAVLTKMAGKHELKIGGSFRMDRMNWYQVGVPGGVMVFDFNSTSEYPWWGGGDAMASFLTGVGSPSTWGEYEIAQHMSTQNFRYGGYIQDNWRVTDKVTLGLGLRYDLEIPRTERFNRMSILQPDVASPVEAGPVDPATWPAALGPVPDLSSLRGGVSFAGLDGNRRTADVDRNNFGPRFSLAYRVRPATVFRLGYGLFYNPTEFGTAGAGPGGIEGFTAVTNWNTRYQGNPVLPSGRMSDPWPDGGPTLPTGSSLGLLTRVGQGVTSPIRSWNATPYTQTWSAGLQQEFPDQILVDANYVGTKGTKLYYGGGGDLNYLGSWVEQATPGTDLLTALNTRVPNPFFGVITDPTSSLSGPEVSASQLLRPYPQFTGFSTFPPPFANSIYHAFQLKVEKRMSQGLQLLVTYTAGKSIDDASLSTYTEWMGGFSENANPNNRKLMRSLSEWDISQVFQIAYVYQLPFGRGKTWGAGWNSILNGFLGGWQTNGIWRFDTGQPIHLGLSGGQSPITYGGQHPNLTAPLFANPKSKWFTDGFFADPWVATLPTPYTLGTAPRMLPNIRYPGTNTASLSVFKEISLAALREGSRLEFRAEAFNALNHPQFGCINSTVNTGGFGEVQCQANLPREIQMALKFYW
ncbi:MAG: TonB-dependent receptor domain-containing protein [Terriglobia bacterium]